MVDLKGQYNKIKNEIDAGIQEVISTTAFVKGPQVNKFEYNLSNYLNTQHVIGCANGTDALQIAMMALNLKVGDEVIIPVFTYVATAEVIALLGLIPVMVDVDAETFCIDTTLIESKITTKTKAIIPVHLFGQCANMEAIMKIAQKHKLLVIEDTAQALGAVYTFSNGTKQRAGCIGNIGTTSFFPSKNLGCYGDGGALLTNDDELAKKIRMIANHGQSIQYVHEVIGVNSRLDSIQAAVLNAKLPHLDSYEKARMEVANCYNELLNAHPQITIPKQSKQSTHVFHQYTIQLNNINRDVVKKKLLEYHIPSMVYYPVPLHQQSAFANYGYNPLDFPVSNRLCQSVLSLPIHTEMTKKSVVYIASHLLEAIK